MNFKKEILTLLVIIVFVLTISISGLAQEGKLNDPDIPDSWYKAPKTASEVGISEFNQSPMLDDEVAEGELPPVEERLPDDPPVIETYKEIGEYGGKVRLWDNSLRSSELWYFNGDWWQRGIRGTPQGKKVPGTFVKDWDYSDDFKALTVHLRKGIKWSDGEPLTADDFLFWWEHEATNNDLNPVSPENWAPPINGLTKEGKWSFSINFGKKVSPPLTGSSAFWAGPSHLLKKLHPDIIGEEKANKLAQEAGLDEWYTYYDRIKSDSPGHPEYEYIRPTVTAYIVEERTETTLTMKRNPYYPFVDTEGNQLPYIDKIEVNLAQDPEMAVTKMITGDSTFSARHPQSTDLPLYKNYEEKEDYKTLIYSRAYGAEVGIHFNLTVDDSKLREIFQNVNFRRAVSLGIDRQNINKKVFFGEAEPRQATVLPTHEPFEEEWAEAYVDYNPEKAKELLNEIGLKDVDNDGDRETPNGETFNPTFLYCKMGPIDPTPVMELVQNNLKNIGLNIDLKFISRELHEQRRTSNEWEISAWTLDGILGDLTQSLYGMRFFAPVSSPEFTQWPSWVNWYTSGGESGEEPPSEVKNLIGYAETAASSTQKDKIYEAHKKLFDSMAENLWLIGTVGMGPQPVLVKNNLKNIPKTGSWEAGVSYMTAFHPHQFYLEGAEPLD